MRCRVAANIVLVLVLAVSTACANKLVESEESVDLGSTRSLLGDDAVGGASRFRGSSIQIRSSMSRAWTSSTGTISSATRTQKTPKRSTDVECSTCTDLPPPGSRHSCKKQAKLGRCGELSANGFCDCSCGACATEAVESNTKKTKSKPPKKSSDADLTSSKKHATKRPASDTEDTTVSVASLLSIPISSTIVPTKKKPEEKAIEKRAKRSRKKSVSPKEPEEDEAEDEEDEKEVEKEEAKKDAKENTKEDAKKSSKKDAKESSKKDAKEDAKEDALENTVEDVKEDADEPVCHDIPPPWSPLSCSEQAELKKCNRDWMRGYCLRSCVMCAVREKGELGTHDDPAYAKCPESCNNNPPVNKDSCEELKTNGECDRSWMKGHCECTCGRCSALKAEYESELKEREAQRLIGPCEGMTGAHLEKCKKKEASKKRQAESSAGNIQQLPKGHARFTIIHFNDFHSRVEPANELHGECTDYFHKEGRCHGGIARMKVVIEEERAKAKARGEEVLLLNAGDDFAGTKWDYHFKGKAVAHFFNNLGIDAMTLGNHEFDYGPDTVARFVKSLNYPVISSNMKANGHWLGGLVKDSLTMHVNGTKVGICGTTSQVTMSWSHPWPVQFDDSTWKAKECVQKLKSQGINIVILLSHEGLNADRYLGRKVPGVDLIIGGHSHAFLYGGTPPAISHFGGHAQRDHIWDGYPAWIDSWVEKGRRVPIVQAGWASRYIGVLTVEFDANGEIHSIEGRPILLGGEASDNPVEEDQALKKEIASWKYW